jgi:hypothetical protein
MLVLAIAIPVSYPGACVTNGKSRSQEHLLIMNRFAAVPVNWNRGCGSELDGCVAAAVL